MSNVPGLSEQCGGCHHSFAEHFITFGGTAGCSKVSDSQRDTYSCSCKGFMVIYHPPRTPAYVLPHHPLGAR